MTIISPRGEFLLIQVLKTGSLHWWDAAYLDRKDEGFLPISEEARMSLPGLATGDGRRSNVRPPALGGYAAQGDVPALPYTGPCRDPAGEQDALKVPPHRSRPYRRAPPPTQRQRHMRLDAICQLARTPSPCSRN
jgi:hypothetical protein